MSAPPYMKWFWADYHQDTRHLSRSDHGAYFLLIGEAWNRGGQLPDDDTLLARWALATPREWADLKPTIMAFFSLCRGQWKHKRITRELGAYAEVSRKRKDAGKKGGSTTRGKYTGKPQANATANAPRLPPKPEPEPEPEKEGSNPAAAESKPPRADDWPAGDLQSHRQALLALAGPGMGDPAREAGLFTTIAEIDRWRRMGCSWSLDVVPIVVGRTAKPRTSPLRTWSALTSDVLGAKARREAEVETPNVIQLQATGPPSNAAAAMREEGRRRALAQYEADG